MADERSDIRDRAAVETNALKQDTQGLFINHVNAGALP
jgi:hypothetical protein